MGTCQKQNTGSATAHYSIKKKNGEQLKKALWMYMEPLTGQRRKRNKYWKWKTGVIPKEMYQHEANIFRKKVGKLKAQKEL